MLKYSNRTVTFGIQIIEFLDNRSSDYREPTVLGYWFQHYIFNENFGKGTAPGTEQPQICFPKPKQGEFTPKLIPVAKNYS